MKKTRTSTEVKNRYNKKTYEQINIRIPKETANTFKEKCREKQIPQAQIFKEAIENFIK